MNKIKRLWLLAIMMCTTLGTSAHDFEVDGIYYKITSSSSPYTVAVTYQGTSYSSYSNEYTGSVTIPESVTYGSITYSVTSIGRDAFNDCSGLTSITIPNSVISIGYFAFYGCTGLTSVTIPNSVTSIGNDVFKGCNALTSAIIGNNVTRISEDAFSDCSGLTSITIPNSVTAIADYAFSGCSALTSVNIGNSVTSIGKCAFCSCSSLTSINIPNSVTSIGEQAFIFCSALTSVTIGNGVTSIGRWAFSNTAWINNQPNGLVYAGKVAYSYKGTMPECIVLDEGTLGIADYAFSSCWGLTSITIPNSVTSIGTYAFMVQYLETSKQP